MQFFFGGGGARGFADGWGKYMFMCVCGRGLLGYSVVDSPPPHPRRRTLVTAGWFCEHWESGTGFWCKKPINWEFAGSGSTTLSLTLALLVVPSVSTTHSPAAYFNQCCGSGSVRSLCFWASRIRIHYSEIRIRIRLRIFISSSKNSKKNIDSYCFVTSAWLFIFEKLCILKKY